METNKTCNIYFYVFTDRKPEWNMIQVSFEFICRLLHLLVEVEDLGEVSGSYCWHVVGYVLRCVRYSDTTVQLMKRLDAVKYLLISHSGYNIINIIIFQTNYILACLHVVGLVAQQGYISIFRKMLLNHLCFLIS